MALPDFKRVKAERKRALLYLVQLRTRGDRILREIRRFLQHEGGQAVYGMVTGEESQGSVNRLESVLTLKKDELPTLSNDGYVEKFMAMADEFTKQMYVQLFKTVGDMADKHGMTIEGQGRSLPEQFIEANERVQFDFDEFGEAQLPTLYMHPDLFERFKSEMAASETDPDYRRRLDEIRVQKYVEWRDREADRRLVD
jgi:hypothetical protein